MSSPETPTPVKPSTSTARDVERWQRRLLPYMSRFLVVLALGFVLVSLFDEYQMRSFLKQESTKNALPLVQAAIEGSKSAQKAPPLDPSVVMQQSLLLLEASAMDRRYSQATTLLMSRIWTRQLAFLTGMVLVFIGAVFILGKLSETTTDVSLGTEQWKGAISSSSPGLILAAFGTVLIAISLIVQPKIEVQDRPVYFVTMGMVRSSNSQATADEGKIDTGPINPGLDTSPTPTK